MSEDDPIEGTVVLAEDKVFHGWHELLWFINFYSKLITKNQLDEKKLSGIAKVEVEEGFAKMSLQIFVVK